ncbi:cell wall protein [Enterococcus silesiacus]|uniref:Cell wall protein n=1 Tax=Enterococcus silesiacus TaxID=332949 RepID=A0A0S3K6Y9_9ENTE|nr:LPXTG cell wall anchor domain-containing protein [Enterococcus silesiacus]ALS00023.1 cell wall protein [Enterococcus silesiacus]OJG86753.1 LPXTG-domain-containing protein cell wall anchor domain [Enterococcus silesiacus]
MNPGHNKIRKKQLISIILFFSLTTFFAPTVSANQTGEADVGITFKKMEDDTPAPHDNTLTADKPKPINNRVKLPNTGETVKQLSLLISGMILIVISFAIILDKQIKVSSE